MTERLDPAADYAAATSDLLLHQQARIVERLRDLTDRVERMTLSDRLANPHGYLASEIVHEITTTLMNTPLQRLITCASDADVALSEAKR